MHGMGPINNAVCPVFTNPNAQTLRDLCTCDHLGCSTYSCCQPLKCIRCVHTARRRTRAGLHRACIYDQYLHVSLVFNINMTTCQTHPALVLNRRHVLPVVDRQRAISVPRTAQWWCERNACQHVRSQGQRATPEQRDGLVEFRRSGGPRWGWSGRRGPLLTLGWRRALGVLGRWLAAVAAGRGWPTALRGR